MPDKYSSAPESHTHCEPKSLTRCTLRQHVLRAYDSVRVPRATFIAEKSRQAGEVLHGRGTSGPSEAGRREDMKSQQEGIWNYDVKEGVARAVAILEARGVF